MSKRIMLIAALLLCLLLPRPGDAAAVLRVCADPDNMPFSSSEGGDRGLYVELAELLSARMGARAEYFWWRSYFGKRTVRNTLLSDQCDAYFGLPYDKQFMSQSVTLTRPFLSMGYALIAPRPFAPSSLDDLKGKKVAVQFGSSPQILLSSREGQEVATFRLAEEALEALTRREVQAAFVWGPTAGYYNKTRLGGQYEIAQHDLLHNDAVGGQLARDDVGGAAANFIALGGE